MSQVEKALTLDEFLMLPETEPASEYLDGQVVQKVTPKKKHGLLQGEFYSKISAVARPKKLGMVFPELRCTFASQSLVFDLAYFQWNRVGFEDTGEPEDDTFDPPDWVIEILSPGQTVANMTRRCSWCVENGVRLAWLVEPRREQVQVFRPDREVEVLSDDAILDASEVLPDFRVHVSEVFDWLRPGKRT